MMRLLSISAVAALAFAGAANASPQEAAAEEGGFNLMMPGDDLEASSDDGWNLGVSEDVTEDGFVIPEGAVENRLEDVAEIPTGDAAPTISATLPEIKAPEDDLIRIE